MVGRLEQAGQEYNMLINSTKTKILTTADEQITVTVGGSVLEQVDTFCYLGSMIHNDARSRAGLRHVRSVRPHRAANFKEPPNFG